MKLTDKAFRYVPAAATDIRKTFARIRREQRKQEQQQAATPAVLRLRRGQAK